MIKLSIILVFTILLETSKKSNPLKLGLRETNLSKVAQLVSSVAQSGSSVQHCLPDVRGPSLSGLS